MFNKAFSLFYRTTHPFISIYCYGFMVQPSRVIVPVELKRRRVHLPIPAWPTIHVMRINSMTPQMFNMQRTCREDHELHSKDDLLPVAECSPHVCSEEASPGPTDRNNLSVHQIWFRTSRFYHYSPTSGCGWV